MGHYCVSYLNLSMNKSRGTLGIWTINYGRVPIVCIVTCLLSPSCRVCAGHVSGVIGFVEKAATAQFVYDI